MHKNIREIRTPFPPRGIRKNPRSICMRVLQGDGATCSKNRKITSYHRDSPNTRNGVHHFVLFFKYFSSVQESCRNLCFYFCCCCFSFLFFVFVLLFCFFSFFLTWFLAVFFLFLFFFFFRRLNSNFFRALPVGAFTGLPSLLVL